MRKALFESWACYSLRYVNTFGPQAQEDTYTLLWRQAQEDTYRLGVSAMYNVRHQRKNVMKERYNTVNEPAYTVKCTVNETSMKRVK